VTRVMNTHGPCLIMAYGRDRSSLVTSNRTEQVGEFFASLAEMHFTMVVWAHKCDVLDGVLAVVC
jgi:hypothetical protein